MTPDEALTQGHFESAIAIPDAEVRSAPDPNRLFLLVELKGYVEDFDAASAHLVSLDRLLPDSFADSVWRPARVRNWTGNQAPLRVYAYHVGTGKHRMELIRRCRLTSFGDENGYRRAHGQRDWQLDTLQHEQGMSLVGINNVKRITFRRAAA